MTKTKVKKGFTAFLTKFPIVKLPLVLDESAHHQFNKNKPLSAEQVRDFCKQPGDGPDDEYTEYLACLRLPDTDFYGLVCWKAGLLEYTYFLAIFDKTGELIEKKVIGGTKIDNDSFHTLVATVSNSWNVRIDEKIGNQSSLTSFTNTFHLSISKKGKIAITEALPQNWNI